MSFARKLYIAIVLIAISINLHSQQERFKAVFIFNFTKYIEWSASDKQGDFVIGVIGTTAIVKDLEVIARKMKVGNQPITIRQFRTVDEVERCHLLYISPDRSNDLAKALIKFSSRNTLIITDKHGMIKQGSGINFYSDEGEVKFEISKNNIEKNGLKINPTLLLLGKSS